MPSIFKTCEGGVYKHTPTANECTDKVNFISIKVAGFIETVPVTGYTLELSTNHQFLHSLDGFIYVYSFGDRVGELTLSGVAFNGCVWDGSADVTNAGAKDVFQYYINSRLTKTMAPAEITIGNSGSAQMLGFLTGMRLEVPNPANPIVQWVLRYTVVINAPRLNSNTTALDLTDGVFLGIGAA